LWLLTALVLLVGLLQACSVDEDELAERVGSLPGAVRASASCVAYTCSVLVVVEPDASPEQLTTVLAAARDTDHAHRVELVADAPGRFALEVEAEGERDLDPALAALLHWSARTPDVTVMSATTVDAHPRVQVTLDTGVWEHAVRAWELAGQLPGVGLELLRREPTQQVLRLRSAPDPDALALAAELDLALAVLLLVVAAVVTVAPNGLAFTAVAERAGPHWSGRALGMQNTAQFLTASAVPPLAGLTIGHLGYAAAFALAALCPVVAAPLVPVRAERPLS